MPARIDAYGEDAAWFGDNDGVNDDIDGSDAVDPEQEELAQDSFNLTAERVDATALGGNRLGAARLWTDGLGPARLRVVGFGNHGDAGLPCHTLDASITSPVKAKLFSKS